MSPELLVCDIKREIYGWLATHVSLTNKFVDLSDRVLEFIICCKFSGHHPFFSGGCSADRI